MPDPERVLEHEATPTPEKGPGVRTFKVFVDGTYYKVEIEEVQGTPVITSTRLVATAAAPKAVTTVPKPKPPAPVAVQAEGSNGKSFGGNGNGGGNGTDVAGKSTQLLAPMPGVVVRHEKAVGDDVNLGDVILVLEAMKMQNSIIAPAAGKLVATHCEQGQMVRKGALLAVIA